MARTRIVAIFLLISGMCYGQVDSTINKKRLRTFVVASTVAYSASLVGLSKLWYEDAHRQSFRFFNDNAEWKQIDKLGHFYSTFYLSYTTSRILQSCQLPARKSDLIGALTGFGILLPIEILDGYSDAYGASTGDLIANAAGSAFYLAQARLWKEVRIQPKFSFHRTDFAPLRPNVLGDNLPSELLKDYNGQTYWLSFDMDKFVRFPRWLNVAVGYGAQGMIYARDGQNTEAGFGSPYRQYYLSLDVDFTSFRSRSKVVNTLLFIAGMIKVPAPTLEFSRKGTKVHGLYF